MAEFERRTLSQRTKEGMAAARKKGSRIGRPRVLTDEQLQEARWRIEVGGKTTASVAREMDVPQWTLSRSLRRQAETVQ